MTYIPHWPMLPEPSHNRDPRDVTEAYRHVLWCRAGEHSYSPPADGWHPCPDHPRLTTAQAADRLGVTPSRVRQLILDGDLPATKVGRDHLIDPAALEAFAQQPRPVGWPAGRPRKER